MKTDSFHIRKYLKTLAAIAGVFLLLAAGVFFVFRNTLLNKAIAKAAARLEVRYNTTLHIGHASFSGLTGIELLGVSLVPHDRDTLLRADTLEAGIRFWPALVGNFRLKEIIVKSGFVQLTQKHGIKNFDVFLGKRDSALKAGSVSEPAEVQKREKINFSKTAYRIIDGILDQVPEDLFIAAFDLRIVDEDKFATVRIDEMEQHGDIISAQATVTDAKNPVQRWKLTGFADPGKKKADVHFYCLDTGKVLLPYINQKLNLTAGFDSIHIRLDEVDMDGDELHIKGYSAISNFMVNHPKIAKKDVVVDNASVNYHFLLGEDFVSLDSTTSVMFNKVMVHPFVKLDTEKDTVLSLSVDIPQMPAQDFISSLPEGLFNHFKGMEVRGDFSYRIDIVYNEQHPQDLIFESVLKKQGLVIEKYGEANLGKLNGDFVYVPMERGRAMRSVLVSPANPDYTPLDQVSPYLQKCVLTMEDPSFFYHRGFIDEAFRQSLIKNIRKKTFARGASTISMQLVKNVFLTREKTLSRKLEEILLVYILENNRISSKERMLEVYFNIIEWGPNVYGIGEASRFYFSKKPYQLNLQECLFLASIVPRPKGFMWRFDKSGNLKPFAERHFSFITNLMLRRNVLIPEDTLTRMPLSISGNARSFIRIDTLVTDTMFQLNEDGTFKTREPEE